MAALLAGHAARERRGPVLRRTKVEYEDFTLHVMETPQFGICHYDRERDAVEQAARLADR
jgi:hypothetical protein